MLTPDQAERIRTKKIDALTGKHLHVKKRRMFARLSCGVDVMALSVPTLYFVIRYAAKGTDSQPLVEFVWEALAAILFVLAILKIALKWDDKSQDHTRLFAENMALARRATELLGEASPSKDSVQAFMELSDRIEQEDLALLNHATTKERQAAYRQALKEFQPGTGVVCPVCNGSPWRFSPGTCQTCGNIPNNK